MNYIHKAEEDLNRHFISRERNTEAYNKNMLKASFSFLPSKFMKGITNSMYFLTSHSIIFKNII